MLTPPDIDTSDAVLPTKNPQMRFATPLIIILIVVLLIGAGVYAYVQKGNQPADESPSTQGITTTQISDLKTYTNTQYGFEFEHPATWTVAKTSGGLSLIPTSGDANIITFAFSPLQTGTASATCPINVREVECKNLQNAHGVSYARVITAGQSTAQTYKEQTLTGYLINSGQTIVVRTLLTDAAGNTLPSTMATFDAILQSIKSTTQTTTTAQTSVTPQDKIAGNILLGSAAQYENLSTEQKKLVDEYNTYLAKKYDTQLQSDRCKLKYYDAENILVGCAGEKPGLAFQLIERGTWKSVENNNYCNLDMWAGYLETKNYIISVSDGGVCYYKAGDSTITLIPNSEFTHSFTDVNGVRSRDESEESYVKRIGLADDYEVSFNEQTRTLTASVYRNNNNGVSDSPMIREVTFVLP
ncbi:MAG: hypothetical protein NUV60_02260 [Patescibacteria group bacterium]|nr:hypothetical protein [Patescibacteria group bacterium]